MVKESTQITVPVRLVMAKEASWSCNLLSGVFGVKVATNEKSSVFGLEPSIAWSASVLDGAALGSILVWLSRIDPIQPHDA